MSEAVLRQWRKAVSDDLQLFAVLHDREPTKELLEQLKTDDFPNTLGLHLQRPDGKECCRFMRDTLNELPQGVPAETLDELAADFAAIYLNYSLRASPCESVWLDEDHLMCQGPMFEVREWYKRYELATENWRERPDDHMVYQMLFIAHLFARDDDLETLRQSVTFMDEHLLRWLKDFSGRVAQHAGTAYYAGLALLTVAYLEELRTLLEDFLDMPQASPEESKN